MDFSAVVLTEAQQAFADEVLAFLDEHLTPEVYAGLRERGEHFDEGFYVALGAKGWLRPRWRRDDGGAELDDVCVRILETELRKRDAPLTGDSADWVWPAVEAYGDPGLRDELKPQVGRGTVRLSLGYTEPDGGSDIAGAKTQAVRDGDDWVINGAKTFISSGINGDLVVVVCRTDPDAGHKGFTLLVVEAAMEGFSRGRKLEKMGLHYQDTAELAFENVRVPSANLLGKEGRGFYHLMHNLPSERLSIAISAIAGARETWRQTLQYAKDRKAFGQPIGSFQHNRFLLAEMDTELEIGEQYIDRCLQAVVDGELTAVEASKAKWWCTETAKKVIDGCVQLHGGYGYMTEYRVARDYMDNRIMTIFGGTTEIMKDIIGRDLGL